MLVHVEFVTRAPLETVTTRPEKFNFTVTTPVMLHGDGVTLVKMPIAVTCWPAPKALPANVVRPTLGEFGVWSEDEMSPAKHVNTSPSVVVKVTESFTPGFPEMDVHAPRIVAVSPMKTWEPPVASVAGFDMMSP